MPLFRPRFPSNLVRVTATPKSELLFSNSAARIIAGENASCQA